MLPTTRARPVNKVIRGIKPGYTATDTPSEAVFRFVVRAVRAPFSSGRFVTGGHSWSLPSVTALSA